MSEAVIGAHAQDFNTESTGAAIIGTFTTEEVPPVAFAALRELLAWRLAWAGVDPSATLTVRGKTLPAVSGHRDVNNTDCPGDKLEAKLPGLRTDLATRLRASIAKPAVQRAVDGTIYMRSTQTSGVATSAFGYGNLGDLAMMCDWDGDGVPTIGVQRQADGHFYLRNSNTTGFADIEFIYGNPGDIPVCGDWDGDGIDTAGVVRSGTWYLKNDHLGGFADVTFVYGNPDDHAIAGDWNGDGIDTPGVQRERPVVPAQQQLERRGRPGAVRLRQPRRQAGGRRLERRRHRHHRRRSGPARSTCATRTAPAGPTTSSPSATQPTTRSSGASLARPRFGHPHRTGDTQRRPPQPFFVTGSAGVAGPTPAGDTQRLPPRFPSTAGGSTGCPGSLTCAVVRKVE